MKRFRLFVYIAERVTFIRAIAADRRAYERHPMHLPPNPGKALQELSQGFEAIDRHLDRRRGLDLRSSTRKLLRWLTGI